jgi:archaemetzincin
MADDSPQVQTLLVSIKKLTPIHKKLGPPGPNDWLAQHPEPGQDFPQYVQSDPVTARGRRNTIYVQPIGDFTPTQRKIVGLTADFLGRYFALKVRTKDGLPLSLIPAEARRRHPSWGMDQVLSTYVLDQLLTPRLPEDACAFIALTPVDLWPGPGWNFVFGQASSRDRVGVWSFYRNGDPDQGEDAFRLCLLRTLKTATHETCHMFSMPHCIQYECCLCGSNHREESDRRPLELCPVCLAKLCYATGADPARRFKRLAEFCREQGLVKEADFYELSLRTLSAPSPR